MTDKNLRRRLAAVIDQHHQADEWGYQVEECRCGDDRDGTETWADHLALVLSDLLMNEGDELVAVVQGAVVESINKIGRTLIGLQFTPVDLSPISDANVIEAIRVCTERNT